MIHIEKNQIFANDKNLRVASATGDYEDNALIEFYDINNPDVVAGAFAAQFIKYGDIVYKFSDPKEIGAEILKMDPESTHTAASFVRMNNELLAQMNNGSLESTSLDQVIATEKENTETAQTEAKESEEIIEDTSSQESEENEEIVPVVENNTNVSTTTPSIHSGENNTDVSTTTPSTTSDQNITDIIESVTELVEDTVSDTSTTTEMVSEVTETIVDTATSTTQ